MTTRLAARYAFRRLSSTGKPLSEEEKAVENIFIKKTEQEKLDKLARKISKPGEKQTTSSSESATEAKASSSSAGNPTAKVSTGKNRNYGTIAGVVTAFGAVGWYFKSSGKKK